MADDPEAAEIPPELAEMLAQLVKPGEGDAVGAAFERALQLDDEELAVFLEQLAERIRSSPEPLTSADVVSLAQSASHDAESQTPPP